MTSMQAAVLTLATALQIGVGSARSSAQPTDAAPVECTSLLGEPLHRQTFDDATRQRLEDNLVAAERAHQAAPFDESAIIWHARRLGYLGRFRDAIAVLDKGVEVHAFSPRLLRHRGHRWITLREFDRAIADLSKADELFQGQDEIEPDGAPNRLGVPRSTLRFNIRYHLALAHYLKGDFENAHKHWTRCLEPARRNDDMLIATTNWLVLTCRRLGRDDEAAALLAPITPGLNVVEERAYLTLCLLHKGELTEAQALGDDGEENPSLPGINNATLGYGVGAWRLVNGRDAEAHEMFNTCLEGPSWGAFGFIAAEAEVARLRMVTGRR